MRAFALLRRQKAMLVGPALIVGLPDRNGDSTDIPAHVAALLTDVFRVSDAADRARLGVAWSPRCSPLPRFAGMGCADRGGTSDDVRDA
jgi:hypothetical protein